MTNLEPYLYQLLIDNIKEILNGYKNNDINIDLTIDNNKKPKNKKSEILTIKKSSNKKVKKKKKKNRVHDKKNAQN